MTRARVHGVDSRSRANGPGVRFVVWLQGCTLACPGCFNPGTHAAAAGSDVSLDELVGQLARSPAEGLTLSGGEPLQQPEAARALLEAARARGLSTLMFSGYTLEEIGTNHPEVLALLDVLVDGRYESAQRLGHGLRGSSNQRVHLLTSRYTWQDVEGTPVAEVVIGADGLVQLSGVDPVKLRR